MKELESPTRSFSRRQNQIMTLLRENGRVAVEELTALFEVSPQTIRRDLNEMSEARVITRVHGGAIIASGVENLVYEARKLVAQTQKRLIGEAAARLIADNSSLFINIGTTTEEVAHALLGHSGLLVITNNLNVAAELYRNRSFEVIITGGSIRPSDGGIVGTTALDLIRQFRVDTAVIGTSAIDEDGTLLDFDIREVHAARAIIEIARRVILVTDSSKFSHSAAAQITTLRDIDILVTDYLPLPEVEELCRAYDVEVIEASDPPKGDPASPD
jgi:DeoR family transcriptional regulator, glycerol-3-phosphate regulon repressor